MKRLLDAPRRLDEQLDALAHEGRRRLLLGLYYEGRVDDRPVAVDTHHLEHEPSVADLGMHHRDVPKLVELGYVERDPVTDEVERGPDFEDLEPLLEVLVSHAEEIPPLLE